MDRVLTPSAFSRQHAIDHTSSTPVTNFKRSNYWYGVAMQLNRGLHRDGDHIAYEAN